MPALRYQKIRLSYQEVNLSKVAQYLLVLMLRNFSSNGYTFTDPWYPDVESAPGCIIASPSFNLTRDDSVTIEDDPNVRQDYVYNWTRDAALVITEVAAVGWPFLPGVDPAVFDEYITFARLCQQNNDISMACYRIDGKMRDRPTWTHQNDGPALQTLAVMDIWDKLSAAGRTTAQDVANTNINWLIENNNYQSNCFSPWEEREGECFFTLATILKLLQKVKKDGSDFGITILAGIDDAISWLDDRLAAHWSEPNGSYVSVGTAFSTGDYDPNLDVVLACLYGAIESTDEKLLSTASKIRAIWAEPADPGDPVSGSVYQVNRDDQANGRGPLLGRYPSDHYDGEFNKGTGHPWALCTSAFAELYYRVAGDIDTAGVVTISPASADFFQQVGIDGATSAQDAVTKLCTAADQMLAAILYHSDDLQLSEQFDAQTGYERSVQNLTWSYASFLSALRVRPAD